jgi:hypothetical protein
MTKQREKTGNRRPVKVRARRLTKDYFGTPSLDDLRPPFDPYPESPPQAAHMVAREDLDWSDDERAIEALATYLGLSANPADNGSLELELERMWKLTDRSDEALEWRRRAWFYRRVLTEWAQRTIPGFRRQATPGETKPPRWTRAHLAALLDAVESARAILQKKRRPHSIAAALRFLQTDQPYARGQPYLPAGMTFANAKKLLDQARNLGK